MMTQCCEVGKCESESYETHPVVYVVAEDVVELPQPPSPRVPGESCPSFCPEPSLGDNAPEIDNQIQPIYWTVAMTFPSAVDNDRVSDHGISKEDAENLFRSCFETASTSRAKKRDDLRLKSFIRRFDELPAFHKGDQMSNSDQSCARYKRYCLEKDADPTDLLKTPRCFLELIQQMVFESLKQSRLVVEVFPCEKQLIFRIACNREGMLDEARFEGYPVELDIQCIDPVSVEPCTGTFIPLLEYFNLVHTLEPSLKVNIDTAYECVCEKIKAQWAAGTEAFHNRFDRTKNFWYSRGSTSCADDSPHQTESELRQAIATSNNAGVERDADCIAKSFLAYLLLRAERGLEPSALSLMNEVETTASCKHGFVSRLLVAWSAQVKSRGRKLWNVWDWLSQGGHPRTAGAFCRFGSGAGELSELFRTFYVRCQTEEDRLINVPFNSQSRINLTRCIIERYVNVDMLRKKRMVDTFFPLDSDDLRERISVPCGMPLGCEHFQHLSDIPDVQISRTALGQIWKLPDEVALKAPPHRVLIWCLRNILVPPPLEEVMEYFGPRIAVYFSMATHFVIWFAILGVVGFAFQIKHWIWQERGMLDNLFAAIVPAWSCFALEFWKRKEAWHSLEWGQLRAPHAAQSRTAFRGYFIRSPVTGEITQFFPRWYSQGFVGTVPRKFVSYIAILGLACVELVVVFATRLACSRYLSSYLTGFAVGVIMYVFGTFGRYVALRLNKFENHRTNSEFVGEFAQKVFIFEFINRYVLFFYIAFLKAFVEGCVTRGVKAKRCQLTKSSSCAMCTEELQQQIPIVFLVSVAMNFVELLWPLVWELRGLRRHDTKMQESTDILRDRNTVLFASKQAEYGSYDVDGSFGDYFEILIIFGYSGLFAVSFPLAPAITAVVLLIELRVDGIKLCNVVRRPFPEYAKDNQTWYRLFCVVAFCSVISNAALAAFTYDFVGGMTTLDRWMRFFVFVCAICLICVIASITVPDKSTGCDAALARDVFVLDEISGHSLSTSDALVADSETRASSIDSTSMDDESPFRHRHASKRSTSSSSSTQEAFNISI
eukprot:TRINITY_DN11662_c0_g1_i4.p1 TRINITY_DN11662_c0_g1~~TRINITY_DN11662_c0_g1_i4.p1  ORF type:complete len:1081 (-),score=99.49 TRINITY_DN11662_c0_g1_i4:43-3216(-)